VKVVDKAIKTDMQLHRLLLDFKKPGDALHH
jgi:hypothetical protein